MNYKDHLDRQLGFLRRSCDAYDSGAKDEAIRIAVVIRTLLHDKKHSPSLIRLLGVDRLDLLSTCSEPGPGAVQFVGMGKMSMSASACSYAPQLGTGPISRFVSHELWWRAIVMIVDSCRVSRAALVLAAANKDGGAHVDLEFTDEYATLMKDGAAGIFALESDGGSLEHPIVDAHLVSLRQLGFELLSSPQLTALASRGL